jgi:hypothetical protein
MNGQLIVVKSRGEKKQIFDCVFYLDVYRSQGHSFFGKGGRDTKQSQLRYVLRLFRSLISTRDEHIAMDLCDQGIIPSITGLIQI